MRPDSVPTFSNGSAELFYQHKGSGEPVLLTHGYGASAAMWQPQAQGLCDDFNLIRWDMRGHAQSASPAEPSAYSEAHTVADMLALLDHLRIDRVHLGGLSLGGYMSLAFVLAHPQRVRSLMLFNCGPGFKSDQGRAKWNRFAHRLADKIDTEGLSGLGGGRETRSAQHTDAAGLAKAARGMLAQFDDRVISFLPRIQVPTLVLVGADDALYQAGADYMVAKIPGAVKVMVDGAGHASNLDRPDAFNAAVRKFLGSL